MSIKREAEGGNYHETPKKPRLTYPDIFYSDVQTEKRSQSIRCSFAMDEILGKSMSRLKRSHVKLESKNSAFEVPKKRRQQLFEKYALFYGALPRDSLSETNVPYDQYEQCYERFPFSPTFRSSESSSVNSSGSCGTSVNDQNCISPKGSIFKEKATFYTPLDYSKNLQKSISKINRPGCITENRKSKEDLLCPCPQCHVNREFLRRGTHNTKTRILMAPRAKLCVDMHGEILMRKNTVLNEVFVKRNNSNEHDDSDRNEFMFRNKHAVKTTENRKLSPGNNKSRALANLLERRRVAELNSAFETLREMIPLYGNEDRSLSKIKTLRYAMTYMSHLVLILNEASMKVLPEATNFFINLSQKDPLIQICKEHMLKRKIF